jgi:hypothetical protein
MIAGCRGLAVTITGITSKDIVAVVKTVFTSKDIAKANTIESGLIGRIVNIRTAGIIFAPNLTVITPPGGNSTQI